MKKLSTHIKGLDELFLGGIQVMSVTNNETRKTSWKRDSLVIVIRGGRGVNKHFFAMQLMHGLGMSISDYFSKRGDTPSHYRDNTFLNYYSINKPTHLLDDMYLDMLIERWISHTTLEFKELSLTDPRKKDNDTDRKKWQQQRDALILQTEEILQYLFEQKDLAKELAKELDTTNIPDYIADNIIGYNARTNSIHLRTGIPNDDNSNLLFRRRKDSIKAYKKDPSLEPPSGMPQNEKSKDQYDDAYDFASEFLNVRFNAHLNSDESDSDDSRQNGYTAVRNANSARINFFKILNDIENLLSDNNSKTAEEDKSDYKFPNEVVVIDGFSHISEKDLKSLPFSHLVEQLRQLSRISILVFEDTQSTMPDGDIEIEIRANYDESEDYSYQELRISKCVNQLTAIGWHLYKRQDSHIRIYPSPHLLLFRRSYINNQMHNIGRPILENSYAMYLDSLQREALMSNTPYDNDQNDNNVQTIARLKNYIDKKNDITQALLESYSRYVNEMSESDTKADFKQVLERILIGQWRNERLKCNAGTANTDFSDGAAIHDHCPTTAIVGNPNSHKRTLAMSRVFRCAKEGDHVLILLLDKDPEEMRKKMLCPAMSNKFKLKSSTDECEKGDMTKCLGCYNNISFLNVNSGCITPEEFFSMLLDHIKVYTGFYSRSDLPRRRLHIVFDDYHRIDFSFPFLKSSSLFTTALISLCQTHNTGLTILCDKNSNRVREVCALSDNVLCVERDEADVPHKITVFAERIGDAPYTSAILKYSIANALELMECNDTSENRFHLRKDADIDAKPVGSMKEYWRQTYNIKSED